jgi:hypothetical protein
VDLCSHRDIFDSTFMIPVVSKLTVACADNPRAHRLPTIGNMLDQALANGVLNSEGCVNLQIVRLASLFRLKLVLRRVAVHAWLRNVTSCQICCSFKAPFQPGMAVQRMPC